jgi:putative sterol carrier protein
MTAREYLENIPKNITPEKAGDINTTLHFDFGGNEQYSIIASNGNGEFKEGLVGDAECVVKATADDFVKIASGDMNPMMAVMMGKLKLSNPGVMMKYAKMLGLA